MGQVGRKGSLEVEVKDNEPARTESSLPFGATSLCRGASDCLVLATINSAQFLQYITAFDFVKSTSSDC